VISGRLLLLAVVVGHMAPHVFLPTAQPLGHICDVVAGRRRKKKKKKKVGFLKFIYTLVHHPCKLS